MTTQEVAQGLVAHCRKGDFEGAMKAYYSPDIVSVEAMEQPGMSRTSTGLAAVAAKGKWWVDNHEIHSFKVGDPFTSLDKFAVTFDMEVTFKPTGKKMNMKEVGVYTVANGKVVHEEFLYAM